MKQLLSMMFLWMFLSPIYAEIPKWASNLQNIKAEMGYKNGDTLVVNEVGRIFISFDQKVWSFRGVSIGKVKEERHDMRFLTGRIIEFKAVGKNRVEFSGADDLHEKSREPKFTFTGHVTKNSDKVKLIILVDKGNIKDIYKEIEDSSAIQLSKAIPIYFGE